jgi:hypothetical protein
MLPWRRTSFLWIIQLTWGLSFGLFFPQQGNNEFPECDGCFCVTKDEEPCPIANEPETKFDALIPILRAFHLTEPTVLGCNPYERSDCERVPAAQPGGACLVVLHNDDRSCPGQYSLQTFLGTPEEARSAGLYVTHAGPCGVCSSLQDLAVYMQVGSNLKRRAGFCGIIALLGFGLGPTCFRSIGFTRACADMWYYNTLTTRRFCFFNCFFDLLLGRPANGPGPECDLSECIQCDEINSGPIFEDYAGRTRRTSGLLSDRSAVFPDRHCAASRSVLSFVESRISSRQGCRSSRASSDRVNCVPAAVLIGCSLDYEPGRGCCCSRDRGSFGVAHRQS